VADITVEKLKARIANLQQQADVSRANLHAQLGAVQVLEQLVVELETPPPAEGAAASEDGHAG
jgi:hypothetical protein